MGSQETVRLWAVMLPQVETLRPTVDGVAQRPVLLQVAVDGEGARQRLEVAGGHHQAHLVRGGAQPVVVAVLRPRQDGAVVLLQRVRQVAGGAVRIPAQLADGDLLVRAEEAGAIAVLGKAAGMCKYPQAFVCYYLALPCILCL